MVNLKKLFSLIFFTCVALIQGCSSSELPYELKLTSNSSYMWIVDKDGWGVLTEGNNTSDDKLTVEIVKLNRFFLLEDSLIVECLQDGGDLIYVFLQPSSGDNLSFRTQLFTKKEFYNFLSISEKFNNLELDWKDFRLSIFEKIGM